MTRAAGWLLLLLSLPLPAACRSCPPDWLTELPSEPGWIYGAGSCAEVFVDADERALALSRAARVIADALGLDVERRLSVRHLDGRLFVEAVGPEGPVDALDALELVDLEQCGETVHALLRLRRPRAAPGTGEGGTPAGAAGAGEQR